MTTIESLTSWLDDNRLDYIIWDEHTFTIANVGKFYIVEPKNGYAQDRPALFNFAFELILEAEDQEIIMADADIIGYAFRFGSRWYWCDDFEKPQLNELRYLGKEKDQFENAAPFLGIHGWYDLTNGSRDYVDWIKKAKWAGYTGLGIAEENTLAGVLKFQAACLKKEMHFVIGESIVVEDADGQTYHIKLYVQNETGWRNLLMINSEINVFNNKVCPEGKLLLHSEGLICVLTPEVNLRTKLKSFQKAQFYSLYFQFDVSRWDSDERDKKLLLATQDYLKHYYPKLKPALISDAYYLEKSDARIRKDLHAIGKLGFRNQSKDQWFKTPNEVFLQIMSLFKEDDDRFMEIAEAAMEGAREIGRSEFKIDTGKLFLPEYVMTEAEKEKYGDQENMFWELVMEGLDRKITSQGIDEQPYADRIAMEMKVICDAKLYNYFLIIWDFLNWSHSQGWLTGYGRGSAAGSVVAYLLDIVQTDPLQYGLLFERFLNEGRLYKKKKVDGWAYWDSSDKEGTYGETTEYPDQADAMGYQVEPIKMEIKVTGSMPDIDNDVPGEHRDEIKHYLESKYGKEHVASIGTYGTFKIKAAIQSLARRSGTDTQFAKYATGAIDESLEYTGLFAEAQKMSTYKGGYEEKPSFVKEFILDNQELIEKIPLVFGQPNTASMHAGGVIIVPHSAHGIYDQLPVKLVDGLLVSEWEMDDVEAAGFLKMDILGLKQLDKFAHILQMIKDTTGDEFTLLDIPLDDPNVYELFGKGYNEDVFQFGGGGLKGYTMSLKPETIDDLIATVALYRPGPIETGAHNQYVNRKNGIDPVIYLPGTEEILQNTYGLMAYQEQVMQIVQHMASFTLNEADEVRKAIGKKIPELMKAQKDKFIEGAVKNGYPPEDMKWLWDQIEVFAGYSFNKSHAACYAITGYHCQWLKANYPLQFWTVALKYSNDKQIPNRLSEIYSAFPEINIIPVDVNKSGLTYECDVQKNAIYWTISSVKQVGETAVKAILEDRQANGQYFSLEEFCTRMKKAGATKSVTKRTITNMIIAGAFDEIEGVRKIQDRFGVLEKYMNFIGSKIDEDMLAMKKWKEHRWVIEQKKLSGIGVIDFKKLVAHTNLSGKVGKFLINADILETPAEEIPAEVLIAGLIVKCTPKGGDGKKPFFLLEITDGQTIVTGAVWSDTVYKYPEECAKLKEGALIVMTAAIRYDEKYKKANTFYSTKTSILTTIAE